MAVTQHRLLQYLLVLVFGYLCASAFTPFPNEQKVLAGVPQIQDETNNVGGNTTSEPFYMIAHRVHTVQGIRDSLSHGANALEMDMYAWKDGWYADHDGTSITRGDSARTMFEAIASERQAGHTINFVWFDIKTPDRCADSPSRRYCAVEGLQDLSREILEPHGVRVQFGFYNTRGRAYNAIAKSINANEALNLNGASRTVRSAFAASSVSFPQGVMSYGNWILPLQFGNCDETSYYTCTELRQAKASRAFGKVFGWTTGSKHEWYVEKLLGTAGVDGLIYGFQLTSYYDHAETRDAARHVLDWIKRNPHRRYLATQEDEPW